MQQHLKGCEILQLCGATEKIYAYVTVCGGYVCCCGDTHATNMNSDLCCYCRNQPVAHLYLVRARSPCSGMLDKPVPLLCTVEVCRCVFRNLCDVTRDYGCFFGDTVLMGGQVVSSGGDVLVLPPWVRPDMQLEWKGREWDNE